MQANSLIETGIIVVVATALCWAAITDLRYRRISNGLCISIAGLFLVFATLQTIQGDGWKPVWVWPVVSALIVFAAGAALFAAGLMGGGDVKLMAATALFAGPALSLSFILYVTIAGGFIAVATLLHARFKSLDSSQAKVPYGVAIALGGMWVCFQRVSALSA